MNLTKVLATSLLGLCLVSAHEVNAFTKYDDPFQISSYVTEPAAPIKEGMKRYHWVVAEEEPGRILAVYAHKNHEIKLNIYYNQEKIWFEQVSARNLGCTNCEVKDRHLTNWRVGLRRGIAFALTHLALVDARKQAKTE
ncbi:hypothetical protein [Simiduia agarivorans]|uniref:Lipoprotein n=1 Tax=Simiduia agarivorans (strain DSM 21679 / JCM 13881 / BCRC 17597 / SA1) TaxID=1117647 RepID=K4KPU8_SIMAS|nr:hypothetical protein [Simiduia agarivorans]AFV00276.1 hypothetical protein M5M_15715 [Simiduia agarivorans SA1 = DSM 21679]